MTVSEELREWALYDKREWALYDKWADINHLTMSAWNCLCEYMDHSFELSFGWPFGDTTYLRTFALLVAEALESEA